MGRRGLGMLGSCSPCCFGFVSFLGEYLGEGVSIHSWIIVGRKTGMELKATLQLKNMNCVVGY